MKRFGIGLKILPAGFVACVGEALGAPKGGGVQNVLDDIVFYSKKVGGQMKLVEQVLGRLHPDWLSVNLAKSLWCSPQKELLGMVINTAGVRPLQSKLYTVTNLSRTTTAEQVKSLLGVSGWTGGRRSS